MYDTHRYENKDEVVSRLQEIDTFFFPPTAAKETFMVAQCNDTEI